MWERSAPSTSSKKLWEGRDSSTVRAFHGFAISTALLWLGPDLIPGSQTFQTHADVGLDPAALPLLRAACIERQLTSPRLISGSKKRQGRLCRRECFLKLPQLPVRVRPSGLPASGGTEAEPFLAEACSVASLVLLCYVGGCCCSFVFRIRHGDHLIGRRANSDRLSYFTSLSVRLYWRT